MIDIDEFMILKLLKNIIIEKRNAYSILLVYPICGELKILFSELTVEVFKINFCI